MTRMFLTLTAVGIFLAANTARADDAPPLQDRASFNLWPEKAPGQKGDKPEDIPNVQVFLPAAGTATGSSVVVCPGGGYGGLADHEKGVVGEWLAKNGVTAFVLRYRLGSHGYHHPIELGDVSRAIRTVRANAVAWKLDPRRIGVLGFSAGGHLASSVATHWDDGNAASEDPIESVSSRPDVQILIYPVISMAPETRGADKQLSGGGHNGSRINLLGKDKADDKELIELLSNEKHVNAKTPPAFLVHGVDDGAVGVNNSDDYAAALKKAGVEVEYVRLDKGGRHGFGLKDFWTKPCVEWLRKMKF
jgi:acetyl esterase/lipase